MRLSAVCAHAVDDALRDLVAASERTRHLETELHDARRALHLALLEAREAGVSVSAIARALRVSRQRIQQMVRLAVEEGDAVDRYQTQPIPNWPAKL
jgi:hypothetical protein